MSHESTEAHGDHQSDPAQTPGDGWVGEGGASHLGPATHTGQEMREEDNGNDASDDDEDRDE